MPHSLNLSFYFPAGEGCGGLRRREGRGHDQVPHLRLQGARARGHRHEVNRDRRRRWNLFGTR